ncbi:chromosome partitioning protein [Microbacterium trichothecenolyticum]|uniref:ParA family protein n=1 Tax=Microbacterium trichothecenolyticum TaxID=69370 RepID=UPI0028589F2E|nr:ParA family protein [Microbacterium trichothecenolyticum]MDR7113764.1 chromosome partitioning protein [Microbacterium trichothecenolyticum]
MAVANQKGGVGKTTVAMQVGAELSRRHRVLLVDVDRQQSTVWWAENARDQLPFDFAGSQHPNMLSRLRELRVDYEFVLVDTPGSLEDTAVLETVLDAADYVLVPVTPEPLAVEPTLRTLSRLIEPRHLRHGVLLNRIDPRVPRQLETWQRLLDAELGVPGSTPISGSTRPTPMPQ